MKLKEALEIPCGLRYVVDQMDIRSALSRGEILERRLVSDIEEAMREYDAVWQFVDIISAGSATQICEKLRHKLTGIRNIVPILDRIERGGVADEVNLFEIKTQAILAGEVATLLRDCGAMLTFIEDVDGVVSILDPDSLGVPTFYVYDSYSEKLGDLRRSAKRSVDPAERELLIQQSFEEEVVVREQLSERLKPFIAKLRQMQQSLMTADIRLASAGLIVRQGLARPKFVSEGDTVYENMFHPQVGARLEKEGRHFQPVDIVFGGDVPTTIIGANMGGKTVTLKMLALSQLMAQFCLGVPASEAKVAVKHDVALIAGDENSDEDGLSSFGSEIRRIGEIIAKARAGDKLLALVDEPARTTNPVEGAALAAALVNVMRGVEADMVLTTHYNLVQSESRRLRVAGYRDGKMDYSLIPTDKSEVPHEALTIAKALGADNNWIDEAEKILNILHGKTSKVQ